MEDMARLAVLEQNIRDEKLFYKTLNALLDYIETILENPHDYTHRRIKSDLLEGFTKVETVIGYLEYVGFEMNEGEITFPKEQSLNKLKLAQIAIARKLYFAVGPNFKTKRIEPASYQHSLKKTTLTPANVLNTSNDFLLRIGNLFNEVLKYEDEELQRLARESVPLVSLQMKALDRMRERQRQIKSGETQGQEMSFDIAQLMELTGWFKYSFFKWVDRPQCGRCKGNTTPKETYTMKTETETCRVEEYWCTSCRASVRFPRYNDPRTLLRTRRGRCGEWANCFALLCRALGYDTRYVYATTDHVWCEVFDHESGRWMHVDPCEAKMDTPLMYEHGWGTQVAYVIAVSRDDIQDVTWRYSSHHKEVLERRQLCTEKLLLDSLLALRGSRQRQVSEPRRRYLARRCLQELVQIMVERQPSEYESHGRISGSGAWRQGRGEARGGDVGHTFFVHLPGHHSLRYFAASDRYLLSREGDDVASVLRWEVGVYSADNVFRKEEDDWRMVYLARNEDATSGHISWKLSAQNEDVILSSASIRAVTKLYETGVIKWSLKFDNDEPIVVQLGGTVTTFQNEFKHLLITAELSGGKGDVAWQHSQLFRQSMDSEECSLEILTVAKSVANASL